jgi:hypothetical protein
VPYRPQPIDVTPYGQLIEEASTAYKVDASYAIAMSDSAHGVKVKRAVWLARSELRAAAKEAAGQCSASRPAKPCDLASSCGAGACEFASSGLKFLKEPVEPGPLTRPRMASDGSARTYSVEPVVRLLARHRSPSLNVPLRNVRPVSKAAAEAKAKRVAERRAELRQLIRAKATTEQERAR